jgi:hypothetical protein
MVSETYASQAAMIWGGTIWLAIMAPQVFRASWSPIAGTQYPGAVA